MYNFGTIVITYFNNYFKIFKTKQFDNAIGQKYEDYINNNISKLLNCNSANITKNNFSKLVKKKKI